MTLPLPLLTFLAALGATGFVARLDLGVALSRAFFVAFFVLVSCGTFLVALRFGYGIDSFVPLQRVLPLFAGPLLYLGFWALCVPKAPLMRAALLHMGVPFALAVAMPLVPGGANAADGLILLSYLTYTLLLVLLWRKGEAAFVRVRLEAVQSVRAWALWAALFLAVFLVIDGAIAVSFAFGRAENAFALISLGSVGLAVTMIAIAFTAASRGLVGRSPSIKAQPSQRAEGKSSAAEIEGRARSLLESEKLYLETDLTVERLAKRLHLPTRSLSAAINQQEGINVSQYVNAFRLRHAAQLLAETSLSVTKLVEQSGFLTRSNFYREFQRAYGCSPAAYRAAQAPQSLVQNP